VTAAQREALADADRALAERNRAEARKLLAEAVKADADAAIRAIDLADAERKQTEALAANKYHHVYRFTSEVNSSTVAACMGQLDIWSRVDPLCEITVIFTSPGGSVVDGMAFWDYLQALRTKGHRLHTHTEGMAASMAGILLQAGDLRSMGKESYLLVHEVQAGMMGSFGELSDRMEWLKVVQNRILNIFAERSHLSKAAIKRRWTRTNWWMDSDQALKLGFVDEVT